MLRFIVNSRPFANNNKFVHTSSICHGSLVTCTNNDGVRQLVLNDPKRRNALSMEMMDELLGALDAGATDRSTRCIVIASTGPVYSSGHNLKELVPENGYDFHTKVFGKCRDLMKAIRTGPVPIIAKVDGLAAAAGCQLVASCDMAVASDRSSFSTPGASFGIFCSTPGIAVARAMPRSKALYMLFTGLPISAKDAYLAGMVTVVTPQETLDEEVNKICDAIKTKSRDVIQLGKEFFNKQIQLEVDEAYKCGETVMADNLAMTDGQEGIRSFVEKRKPQWKS